MTSSLQKTADSGNGGGDSIGVLASIFVGALVGDGA